MALIHHHIPQLLFQIGHPTIIHTDTHLNMYVHVYMLQTTIKHVDTLYIYIHMYIYARVCIYIKHVDTIYIYIYIHTIMYLYIYVVVFMYTCVYKYTDIHMTTLLYPHYFLSPFGQRSHVTCLRPGDPSSSVAHHRSQC